jgi:hypothetical protein
VDNLEPATAGNEGFSLSFVAVLMSPLSIRLIVPILVITLASCGSKPSDSGAAQAFDSVRLVPYSGTTAVAVTYQVRDYKNWLLAYNNLSDPDSRLSVFASPDDPNLITVFELTKSHQDARNVFSSPHFRETLEAEGVTSEPLLNYFDVKFRLNAPSEKLYRLGVTHEVEDYDHWRKVFDEDEPIRSKANLELRAISTNADNPLIVNILFATDNLEKAKEVINSEELKKRMKEAGVRSEPVFAVFIVPEVSSN